MRILQMGIPPMEIPLAKRLQQRIRGPRSMRILHRRQMIRKRIPLMPRRRLRTMQMTPKKYWRNQQRTKITEQLLRSRLNRKRSAMT